MLFRSLLMQLISGDLQNGYYFLEIIFEKAPINFTKKGFVILASEVEYKNNLFFLHLITSNYEEIDLSFSDIKKLSIISTNEENYLNQSE